MTGAYLLAYRDGRRRCIEIDRMTDGELDDLEKRAAGNPAEGWKWAKFLAGWIRDNIRKGSDRSGTTDDDAKDGPIPEELWMLRLAWNGWFVLADDDLPRTNPYLVFLSREHAEVAANRLRDGEVGIECIAVMVKGPG